MPPAKKAAARRPAPQDHKKKAASPRPRTRAVASEATQPDFEFEHDGYLYTLPFAAPYVQGGTGGELMDAMLDNTGASETRLALAALKAAEPDIDPDAYAAIRSKSTGEFLDLVGDWLVAAQQASLGESRGSST